MIERIFIQNIVSSLFLHILLVMLIIGYNLLEIREKKLDTLREGWSAVQR